MRTEDNSSLSARRRLTDPTLLVAAAGLVLFVVLAVMVHARWLAGLDYGASVAKRSLEGPLLDGWAAAVSILASGELCLLYGAACALLLWRAGLGRWALAPLAFLPGVLLELLSKLTIRQPLVPPEFWRPAHYPFVSVSLAGSFPSGHAMRSGFFCFFLAVLLWERGGMAERVGAVLLVALALLFGLARVYGGQHWLSDVIAGLALGATMALLVAPPVSRRLRKR